MELVGPTLQDVIDRHSAESGAPGLPLERTLAIARQIATALDAAHERAIIHRDLKPANIKVGEDGTVMVLDFGLAKALAADGESAQSAIAESPTLTARPTQLGVILGTAAYMAPEQARRRAVDRRADVWAFGVVLFEMLTGRRAFDGDDVSDVLAALPREGSEEAAAGYRRRDAAAGGGARQRVDVLWLAGRIGQPRSVSRPGSVVAPCSPHSHHSGPHVTRRWGHRDDAA